MPATITPHAGTVAAAPQRPLTLALLMPSDGSPFLSWMKIVGNGLVAANHRSPQPAELLLVGASDGVSIEERLQAAALSGADAAIGPLDRDELEKLAAARTLPLPTLALNAVNCPASGCPPELAMLSISTEHEAEWIARIAVRELAARLPAADNPPTKAAVLCGRSAWEERIAQAYSLVLAEAGIDHEIIIVTPESLSDVARRFEPDLSEEDSQALKERTTRLLAEARSEDARKRVLRTIAAERRAKVVDSAPPFQAAFLALSAQDASLIRNLLPRRTRIWATSATNPGDPAMSSTAATLAYDLDRLVFTDCPLVVRYDKDGFEAHFGTDIPYSLAAKRLFALGADALEAASRWATRIPAFEFSGETGQIRHETGGSALLARNPQVILVENGTFHSVTPESTASASPVTEQEPDVAADSP